MNKRLGAAIIIIEDPDYVSAVNQVISKHADLILGRQGIPIRDRGISIISLVLEGNTDDIGSLTGSVGRIKGVRVKSILTS